MVIDTFSLCVIKDPLKALEEMSRVVKPKTGRIILLENNRSNIKAIASLQDLTEPIITPLSKECRWNLDIAALAKTAGLNEVKEYHQELDLGTIILQVYRKE